MIETTDAERTLLSAARRALSPTEIDQARVRESIETALAAGAPDPLGADPAQASQWVPKLLLVAAVAATSGGVGYWAGHRAGRQEVRSVAVTVPAARGPIASAPEISAPAVPFAQRRQRSARASASNGSSRASWLRGRRAGRPRAFAARVAGAKKFARCAPSSGRCATASPAWRWRCCASWIARCPQGRLHEERQATEAIARCATGDVPFGVNLAEEFSGRYPASVYGRRVADSCAQTDSNGPGDSSGRRSRQ